MTAANYDSTTVTATADDYTLKVKGRVLRFDGWTKVIAATCKNVKIVFLPGGEKVKR